MRKFKVQCPVCAVTDPPINHQESLDSIIIELNDAHKWTREQIADWIDTLDDQPTFYPSISTEIIPKVGSTKYTRTMSQGPDSMTMVFTCGCAILRHAIICGACKAIGDNNALGHACYECTNDTVRVIPRSKSKPQPKPF